MQLPGQAPSLLETPFPQTHVFYERLGFTRQAEHRPFPGVARGIVTFLREPRSVTPRSRNRFASLPGNRLQPTTAGAMMSPRLKRPSGRHAITHAVLEDDITTRW